MKIIFLGTNGWYDTDQGNTVCTLVDTKEAYIVLDAGFGIYKLDKYIKEPKPIYLFISHLHLDHIVGIHTLMKFRFKNDFHFVISKQVKKYFNILMNGLYCAKPRDFHINIKTIDLTDTQELPFKLQTKKLAHEAGTTGYRLEADEKVVVYCCDTAVCDNAIKLSKDADVLIHESAMLPFDKDKGWGHSNPMGAAEVAKKARAKRLVLTHFGANVYTLKTHRKEAEKRARKIFPNTIVAQDNMIIKI